MPDEDKTSRELDLDYLKNLDEGEEDEDAETNEDEEETNEEETDTEEDDGNQDDEETEGDEVDKLLESKDKDDDIELDDLDDDLSKSLTKLKKVDKDFLKNNPVIVQSVNRLREYDEMFESTDEAAQVVKNSESYSTLVGDLLGGNTSKILKAVKEYSSDSFDRVTDTILDEIYKVDKNKVNQIYGRAISRFMLNNYNRIKPKNPEDTSADGQTLLALEVISKNLFNQPNIKELIKEEDPEILRRRSELNRTENEKANKRLEENTESMLNDTNDLVSTLIDNTLAKSKLNSKAMVKIVGDHIYEAMSKKTNFNNRLDKLIRSAQRSDFSSDSVRKFKKAFLTEARNHISKATVLAKKDLNISSGRKKVTPKVKPGTKSDKNKKSGVDYDKMSDMDIIKMVTGQAA